VEDYCGAIACCAAHSDACTKFKSDMPLNPTLVRLNRHTRKKGESLY